MVHGHRLHSIDRIAASLYLFLLVQSNEKRWLNSSRLGWVFLSLLLLRDTKIWSNRMTGWDVPKITAATRRRSELKTMDMLPKKKKKMQVQKEPARRRQGKTRMTRQSGEQLCRLRMCVSKCKKKRCRSKARLTDGI